MRYLNDDFLARLAADLEADLHATTSWFEPPRLFGLARADLVSVRSIPATGGEFWLQLAEGDPYEFLDVVAVDERETPALALAGCGWAFPPDDPASWFGRPSEHPERVRVRTVAVVTPDGRQCSAIRQRRAGDPVSLDDHGEGPMLRALLRAWDVPGAA